MAGPYYLRSTDGSDASDGLTWANAKATLVGAFAVAAAGERIWVSHVHAETQATAMVLTSLGTSGAPVEVLCGNDAAEPPTALATTATVTTTGTSAMSFGGVASVYGIRFSAGTGAVTAPINFVTTSSSGFIFDSCAFALPTTVAGSKVFVGSTNAAADDQTLTLINSTIQLAAHASAGLSPGNGRFTMRGGAFVTTATPTTVIVPVGGANATVRFVGVDLSLFSSKTLINVGLAGTGALMVSFENCKLGTDMGLTTGTHVGLGGPIVFLDNCDSADTQYRMQRHQYQGEVSSETTVVRTGGASNGATPLSHRMVAAASLTFHTPLYGPELVIWNATTGSSKTVTVEIVHDSVTNLQDNEVWLEVEYLGTSGTPLSLFASDRMSNILASAADQATSSTTWTTTGLTNPNTQKLEVTFTPEEIGLVRARVALAVSSRTIWVDPLLTVA